MPTIIDYAIVLPTLCERGLKPLHYNGGVFGFESSESVHHVGWLTGDDPTLTESAHAISHVVHPPTVKTLIAGLIDAWQSSLIGPLWILPGSHWAYELTHGGKENLAGLLNQSGLDIDSLSDRTNASALQFDRTERNEATALLENLLQMLSVTDFMAIFPANGVTALLHHHHQVWWSVRQKRQNEAGGAAEMANKPSEPTLNYKNEAAENFSENLLATLQLFTGIP